MKKKTKNKRTKWEISEFKKEDFDNISKEDLQQPIDSIQVKQNEKQK
ncbi:hypothetical protein NF468_004428 [Salmonella enterica]|nr:hypothetical protein [Salmonella enterica]